MKKTLLFLFAFVAIQLAASYGVQAIFRLTGGDPLSVSSLILSMAVFSIVTIVVFLYAKWCVVSPHYLRTRPWGVMSWSVLAAIGAILPSMWIQEQMPPLPNVLDESFNMILKDRWGYVVVGLLAPLAEELVFRGAILRSLLLSFRRPWVAIFVSALLFALVHANPAQMPHALLVGLLLGWMYWRTGSILPGVAYHWVNNSIAYILFNLLPNPDATLMELAHGNKTMMGLWLLCSLCVLLPSLLQLNLRMRRE